MKTIGPAILMAIGPALMVLGVILAGCSRAAIPTPGPAPTATPAAVHAPAPQGAPATFFLEIATPKDEIVVREATVEVRGRTAPDAVVSINGQPVEVDGSGNFSGMVSLENGPNSIEVIASDFRGNQQSRVISLVYTG